MSGLRVFALTSTLRMPCLSRSVLTVARTHAHAPWLAALGPLRQGRQGRVSAGQVGHGPRAERRCQARPRRHVAQALRCPGKRSDIPRDMPEIRPRDMPRYAEISRDMPPRCA
eukprot:923622-Rhodomonas_salina.3